MKSLLNLSDSTKGILLNFYLIGFYYGVDILESPPTSFEFYKNYVAQNKPCIIKNAFNEWDALKKWTAKYLGSTLDNVLVDVTPNGRADAITKIGEEEVFMIPDSVEMKMSQFLEELCFYDGKKIFYLQHQNNNFQDKEFETIFKDIQEIQFANECFGKIDAINFWYYIHFIKKGWETSFQLLLYIKIIMKTVYKFYNQVYCVISGEKHFTIYPPSDICFLYQKEYKTGNYIYDKENSSFKYKINDEKIPWISFDPLKPDYEAFPNSRFLTKIECVVSEGDLFYLPALWHHHVQQLPDLENKVVAINFW
jgi:peptidyl-lysine (3S)-dioxygenase / protease